MKLKIVYLVSIGLLAATSAFAAEFRLAHERGDRNVTVSSSENPKNLYAVGSSIDINGNVVGDLFAAGGAVTVNGNVEKDLTAGSGNITVNGSTGDDARLAGGNVNLNGPVAGDLLIAGGNLNISDKATIGADLVAAGGSVIVNSSVGGKANINGGDVTINGKITGDLDVRSRNLSFGPNSEVTGQVTYEGENMAKVADGAKIGTINFTQRVVEHPRYAFKHFFAVATLFKLIGLLIAGLVFYWLMPRNVRNMVAATKNNTWQHLGIGLLVGIVTPIVGIILMITVIGFYIGLIVLAGYLLMLLVASVFMLYYLGNLAYGWYEKNARESLIRDLILGTIIALILSFIPIVGWIIILIVWFIVLGSVFTWWRKEQLS